MNNELLRSYKIISNSDIRKEYDYYPTPAIATYVLHKFGNLPNTILEPCAGRGHISKILEDLNYKVTSYDLITHPSIYTNIKVGYDFLELPKQECEGVVTNPPYMKKLPEKFIRKIFKDNYKYCAFLCRNTFMESQGRYKLFKEYPPTKILLFSDRITFNCDDLYAFDKNFGGLTNYAWYIWDYRNGQTTKTELEFILAKEYMKELKKIYE